MGAAAGCQVEPGPFGGVKMVVCGDVGRGHTLAATNFGAAAHLLGGGLLEHGDTTDRMVGNGACCTVPRSWRGPGHFEGRQWH